MGRITKILGGSGSADKTEDDYRDVSKDDIRPDDTGMGPTIKTAAVSNQNGLIPVKDAVYEGNIVVIDFEGVPRDTRKRERIEDELAMLADEVGGSIALNGDNQCIIAPTGISIDTSRL